MIYYSNTLTNTRGDSLVGYRVRLREFADPPGPVVPIFADQNGTPISVQSQIANTAVTENPTGFFGFWVQSGTYLLETLNAAGAAVRSPIPLSIETGGGGEPVTDQGIWSPDPNVNDNQGIWQP